MTISENETTWMIWTGCHLSECLGPLLGNTANLSTNVILCCTEHGLLASRATTTQIRASSKLSSTTLRRKDYVGQLFLKTWRVFRLLGLDAKKCVHGSVFYIHAFPAVALRKSRN